MTLHATSASGLTSSLRVALWVAAAASLTGCASEAALQPPSLHIPANVQKLSAERFGDTVELHWTVPARTTDGVSLTAKHRSGAPFTAEICRSENALPPGPCKPLSTMPVESGQPEVFRDTLTAPWSEGSLRPIHYRVRILNVKGRGTDGLEALVPAGDALPPLTALRAAPAAGGGVTLRWQATATGTAGRVILHVSRSNAKNPVTLVVENTASDPGGANDPAAKQGEAQIYTAFRSRTITVGKQTMTVNSAPTTVTVAKDALPPPPAAPIGFEAVVNTLGEPEVDLVWQAADEAGVVGYIVYRSENAGSAPTPITPTPANAFSYADKAVRPGTRYRYRIAAVNANGVAGPMSVELERLVPAP